MVSKCKIIVGIDLNAVSHWLGANIESALDIIGGAIVIFHWYGSNCITDPVMATGIDTSTSSWSEQNYKGKNLFTNVYHKGCVWCVLNTLTNH